MAEMQSLGVSGDVLPEAPAPSSSPKLKLSTIARLAKNSRKMAGIVPVDSDDSGFMSDEILHEQSIGITNRPGIARMATRDVDALVGLATSPSMEVGSDASEAMESISSQREEEPAAAATHDATEQQLDVEIHLRGKGILATRGTKTDSFVRVMLITDNMTEIEVGKTEIVQDTLDPVFLQTVQLRFRLDDTKHRVRIEMCDPGETDAQQTEASAAGKNAAVLGAFELTMQDLVSMVMGEAVGGTSDTPRSKRSGVHSFELVPLTSLQGARRQSFAATSAMGGTPGGGDKKKASDLGLGEVVLVPEIISADRHFCWLVVGASGLRTENLSLPPNPYLKIFRLLADDTRAPVYETGHVRGVRDCAWKTVPIPLQRLHNGDPLRMVALEVWDFSDVSGNRLFGSAQLPAKQLLQGAETFGGRHGLGEGDLEELDSTGSGTDGAAPSPARKARQAAQQIPLQRPALADRRGSLTQTILGFGRAASPGNLTILRAEIDAGEEEAMQVFKTFDVEGIRRENHNLAPPTWMPLAERYAAVERKRQLGLRTSDVKCFTGCVHQTRRVEQWFETTDATRFAKKYNPYHYTYLKIGSRFGSGIQALFGFALVLIFLNFILSLFWLVFVVLPQVALNGHIKPFNDIQATVFSDDIDSVDRPTLLYMGGYDTKYYNDAGETIYEMDVAYLCCSVLITFGVSLFWIVSSISGLMKKGQASQIGGDGVGEIIELVFNGWDMLETTKASTKNMREHIATYLKQALLQQDLVASRKQAKSQAEMRKLYVTRAVMISLSFLTLCVSLMTVALVLQPSYRANIAAWIDGTLGEILPSLIISSINMVAPVLLKAFVKLEKWSPEVELRQAIGRIFLLKMLNLIVTALQLENPDDLSEGLSAAAAAANNGSAASQELGSGGDTVSSDYIVAVSGTSDYMAGCQESTAGLTYVQLIFTDMVLVSIASSFPKVFIYLCKVKPLGYKSVIDLPKEVMELIYRQALLWVGALYVPLMFPIGVFCHSVVYFVKYASFRYCYRAPDVPLSRSAVTTQFLFASMFSLLAMVIPFGYALTQDANPFCGPLRHASCALMPYNESMYCTESRYNYQSVYDALMSGDDAVNVFNFTVYGSGTILNQITSCDFSCWLATIATSVLSAPVLIVVGILLCIGLNFTRAKLRAVAAALKRAETQLQEEHHDKIKLLRNNGVQL